MKKITTIIIIIVIIVVSGYGFWKFKEKKSAPTWRTSPAQLRTIIQKITSIGTVNPIKQVNIGTEVSGKIEKLYKDFNDQVKAGELLAKLDTETLEMALEEARIELNKTRLSVQNNLDDYENKLELYKNEMISEYELKQAKYSYDLSVENLQKSQFSVQKAQKNLNNAYIYSPIDGIITSRNVDEGQTVAASLNAPTLFIIANKLEEMQIEAFVDEADIGKIEQGQYVKFTVDAFQERTFEGRIKQVRLNPSSDQNVVTYPVIISINNPDNILMPGMTANLDIIISELKNTVTIQERALQFRPTEEIINSMGIDIKQIEFDSSPDIPGKQVAQDNQSKTNKGMDKHAQIWILENNILKQVNIEVGESDGTYIQALTGLTEGAEVIIGLNYVRNTNSSSSAFSTGMSGRRF